uniref:Uncharacterized protein n=1 Tax=Romanomermis culicivorax TaxID=13658 RepID=A0A915JY82_ROMCU
MALRYILQCLTNTKAPNYLATKERKAIIGDIHQEYQMEMDRKAEEKKQKDAMTLTKPDVPHKYQMRPAPIIATTPTATTQPPVLAPALMNEGQAIKDKDCRLQAKGSLSYDQNVKLQRHLQIP